MIKSIKEERLSRLLIRKNFNKKYNDELIKFLQNNIQNNENIMKTIAFINQLTFTHPGLSSVEYIVHPLRIAVILYKIDNNIDVNTLIIALLHNIFEVSKITEKDLLLHYDNNLICALKLLKVNRAMQNNLDYKKEYYNNIFAHSKGLSMVKTIDKFDNLFLLCLNSNDKVRTLYLNEIETFIYPIVKKHIPILFDYYKNLVTDCKKIGFLDQKKSIKLYNEDYS